MKLKRSEKDQDKQGQTMDKLKKELLLKLNKKENAIRKDIRETMYYEDEEVVDKVIDSIIPKTKKGLLEVMQANPSLLNEMPYRDWGYNSIYELVRDAIKDRLEPTVRKWRDDKEDFLWGGES